MGMFQQCALGVFRLARSSSSLRMSGSVFLVGGRVFAIGTCRADVEVQVGGISPGPCACVIVLHCDPHLHGKSRNPLLSGIDVLLETGALHNLGVPIIVVCCASCMVHDRDRYHGMI